jgi:hypothetical protein
MVMNEAALATLAAGLPRRFADRLPAPGLDGLELMACGGEWDDLLNLLVAALRKTHARVIRADVGSHATWRNLTVNGGRVADPSSL